LAGDTPTTKEEKQNYPLVCRVPMLHTKSLIYLPNLGFVADIEIWLPQFSDQRLHLRSNVIFSFLTIILPEISRPIKVKAFAACPSGLERKTSSIGLTDAGR
jgi:hypothetical protein